MKKIMIAVAIVCAAAMSQAASYTWSTGKGANIYQMNTTTKLNGGTAYLFYATSAESVFNAWNNGKTSLANISGSLDSSTMTSAGMVTQKTASPITLDVDTLTAVIATEIDVSGTKYLYISGSASKDSVTPGSAGLTFTSTQMASSKVGAESWSEGYAGAGWYAASDVPEPTSGLLLLLGMAGLALKRKRA